MSGVGRWGEGLGGGLASATTGQRDGTAGEGEDGGTVGGSHLRYQVQESVTDGLGFTQ